MSPADPAFMGRLCALMSAAILGAACGAARAGPLVLGVPLAPPGPESGAPCQDIPLPAKDYATPNLYAPGAAQDRLNAGAARAVEADSAQIQGLMNGINDLAGRLLKGDGRTGSGDRAVARCIVRNLYTSARAGSLTGSLSPQAAGLRSFVVPALAFDYVLARRFDDPDPAARQAIETWLRRLNDPSVEAESQLAALGNTPASPHRINNRHYWVGYGALLVAIATQDQQRFEWGRRAILRGLDEVDAQGFLPPEAARESRALNYHAYALQPLSMGTYLLAANGERPSAGQMAALQRLGETTAAGLLDPAAFSKRLEPYVGGRRIDQVDFPKTPPYVPVLLKLFGPSPAISALRRKIVRTPPGFIGPSTDDLFH